MKLASFALCAACALSLDSAASAQTTMAPEMRRQSHGSGSHRSGSHDRGSYGDEADDYDVMEGSLGEGSHGPSSVLHSMEGSFGHSGSYGSGASGGGVPSTTTAAPPFGGVPFEADTCQAGPGAAGQQQITLPLAAMSDVATLGSDIRDAINAGKRVCFCSEGDANGAPSGGTHSSICRGDDTGMWSAQRAHDTSDSAALRASTAAAKAAGQQVCFCVGGPARATTTTTTTTTAPGWGGDGGFGGGGFGGDGNFGAGFGAGGGGHESNIGGGGGSYGSQTTGHDGHGSHEHGSHEHGSHQHGHGSYSHGSDDGGDDEDNCGLVCEQEGCRGADHARQDPEACRLCAQCNIGEECFETCWQHLCLDEEADGHRPECQDCVRCNRERDSHNDDLAYGSHHGSQRADASGSHHGDTRPADICAQGEHCDTMCFEFIYCIWNPDAACAQAADRNCEQCEHCPQVRDYATQNNLPFPPPQNEEGNSSRPACGGCNPPCQDVMCGEMPCQFCDGDGHCTSQPRPCGETTRSPLGPCHGHDNWNYSNCPCPETKAEADFHAEGNAPDLDCIGDGKR